MLWSFWCLQFVVLLTCIVTVIYMLRYDRNILSSSSRMISANRSMYHKYIIRHTKFNNCQALVPQCLIGKSYSKVAASFCKGPLLLKKKKEKSNFVWLITIWSRPHITVTPERDVCASGCVVMNGDVSRVVSSSGWGRSYPHNNDFHLWLGIEIPRRVSTILDE